MKPSQEIQKLRHKLIAQGWPKFVTSVNITGIHGLKNKQIDFKFPVCAIVGENGTCKSTILKLLACAYKGDEAKSGFFPSDFFPDTAWDNLKDVNVEYQVKQGAKINTQKITKTTERWRSLLERPKNKVYFFDLNRIQPLGSLIGASKLANKKIDEIKSRDLSNESVKEISEIMERDYLLGRYATTSASNSFEVGLLKFNFGEVSQFHQGSGEAITCDFISAIEHIPDYSLVIIDEVESSLHPKAQRRLIRKLLKIARIKTLQIVFSTHSPYILSEVPEDARILLTRINDGIEIVYAPSVEFCLSQIDDEMHSELDVLVEDNEAKVLLSELLRYKSSSLLERIRILSVGPANVIQILMKLQEEEKLPYNILGIVDADQDNMSPAIKLPGEFSPEEQVIRDLIKMDLLEKLVPVLNIVKDSIKSEFNKIMTCQDSKEWVPRLSSKFNMLPHTLWCYLSMIWVRNCLNEEQSNQILEAINNRLLMQQ